MFFLKLYVVYLWVFPLVVLTLKMGMYLGYISKNITHSMICFYITQVLPVIFLLSIFLLWNSFFLYKVHCINYIPVFQTFSRLFLNSSLVWQDAPVGILMLTNVIDKGLVLYSVSNNNFTGVSLFVWSRCPHWLFLVLSVVDIQLLQWLIGYTPLNIFLISVILTPSNWSDYRLPIYHGTI